MKRKLCKKCNIEKDIEQFRLKKQKNKYYRYCYCKECEKIEKQKYKEANREYSKNYYKKNKEKYAEKRKKYYIENQDKIKKYRKKFDSEYLKKWRKEHPENIKKYIKNELEKTKNNSFKIIKRQSRDTIRNGFRRKGFSKNTKTEKLLGCDYDIFIKHLLKTFKNNYGYEWDGKEKVHIDHIIPLATANTEEDVIKLCYYTNLQLLKAIDNLKKGDKLNYKIDYNS